MVCVALTGGLHLKELRPLVVAASRFFTREYIAMAFDITSDENKIIIYDEKTESTQYLIARDPTPKEQLAYERERVIQKGGKTINRIYQTRLKYGCLVLTSCQQAATPQDDGYGFRRGPEHWMPLAPLLNDEEIPVTREDLVAEFARAYGRDWVSWMDDLAPWVLFLLARAPGHIERVASVTFEGAADYKQIRRDTAEEGDEQGN